MDRRVFGGIVAAFIGTFCVRLYFHISVLDIRVSTTGISVLLSAVMLIVSVLISTLTTRIKEYRKGFGLTMNEKHVTPNLLRDCS